MFCVYNKLSFVGGSGKTLNTKAAKDGIFEIIAYCLDPEIVMHIWVQWIVFICNTLFLMT